MKKLAVGIIALALLALASVLVWNHVALQRPLSTVLASDPRNSGVEARAHFRGYLRSTELVFDLRSVGADKAPVDVFRVLLQFAQALRDRQFSKVVLAHRGTPKFQFKGDYFQLLGREYGAQNVVYTMRTLPENTYRPDGGQAFGQWTGGLLGVLKEQMEDFNEFHQQWYINDLASAP